MRFLLAAGALVSALMTLTPAVADALVAPRIEPSSFITSMSQTAAYFGIDEVRIGPAFSNLELIPGYYFVPDANSFNKARLDSTEFDVLFKSPDIFKWIGSPRPSIGGVVNLEGYESLVHAGIDYHIPLGSSPFYAEFGGGVGLHTGYLDNAPAGFHDLGCPVLLHWTYGLGVNLNDHVTATLDWQHMSNIVFHCNPNQGLNNIGLVIGWKF